jgi:hypothetical protein
MEVKSGKRIKIIQVRKIERTFKKYERMQEKKQWKGRSRYMEKKLTIYSAN